jgi:hypothetical protein
MPPTPTMNLAQVRLYDPIYSRIAVGFRQQGLVGSILFPEAPVDISGGQILQFGDEDFQQYNTERAPGADTKEVEFGYLGAPFALRQHRLTGKVPFEKMRDASVVPGIDLGAMAVNRVMRILRLSLEIDQAALGTNSANYGANTVALSGTAKWSNAASDPYVQWMAQRETIRQQIGMYPNTGIFSATVMTTIKTNPAIRSHFQYTNDKSVTDQMIKELFELDTIASAGAIVSNAGTKSDVWGNNAILAYVAKPAEGADFDTAEPSFGYTYTMRGHPFAEEPYQDRDKNSWKYPVTFERAPVLTGMTAGFLFQNPV